MSIQYLFCTRLGSCTSSVSFVYPFAFTFLVRFLLSSIASVLHIRLSSFVNTFLHLITKMSDMTQHFEVILTSFSSDKCNSQFKFKIKWLLYNVSQRISARAFKCCKQILLRELSLIVCSTLVSSHGWKAFRGLDNQAFPGISIKQRTASEARDLKFHGTNSRSSMFFNSLIEMTSSVAWLSNPQNAFHPWEETKVEHTIWLNLCKSILFRTF